MQQLHVSRPTVSVDPLPHIMINDLHFLKIRRTDGSKERPTTPGG